MSPVADCAVNLVVGVTAHRDIPPGEHAALRDRIRDFLQTLQRVYPELPLMLMNPLAEGGDRLAAQVARELAIPLFAPLPFARDEYERDFSSPASLQEFRDLLGGAQVRELPLAPGISAADIAARGDARNRQYAQLGMFISSHCQILLALWDGNPSNALGGTAQVVDFHLYNRMADLATADVAPNLLADDESDLVYHLVCSRQLGSPGLVPCFPPLHARWLTTGGEHVDAGLPPAHYAHIFAQLQTFNTDVARHREAIERSRLHLLPTASPPPAPPSTGRIDHLFGCADWLALHFQRRVRGSLLLTHTVAALMGLSFILYSDVDNRRGYVLAFVLLFVLGFTLALIGRHRQWHRKYLDYRGLAEGLRVQLYWRLAGVEIPPDSSLGYDSFLQKQDIELSWIRHVMRGTSVSREAAGRIDPCWLDWVIAHWVGDAAGRGGQLEYFHRGGARRVRAYRLTTRLGHAALATGLGGACVLLAGGDRLTAGVQQTLLVAMGLLPLIAGIRQAYSFKKADKELIKQFGFMAHLFGSCRARLSRATSTAEIRHLLLALGKACLEEHAEWILLHRERPLEQHTPG